MGPCGVTIPHTLPTFPQEKGEQEGARVDGPRRGTDPEVGFPSHVPGGISEWRHPS